MKHRKPWTMRNKRTKRRTKSRTKSRSKGRTKNRAKSRTKSRTRNRTRNRRNNLKGGLWGAAKRKLAATFRSENAGEGQAEAPTELPVGVPAEERAEGQAEAPTKLPVRVPAEEGVPPDIIEEILRLTEDIEKKEKKENELKHIINREGIPVPGVFPSFDNISVPTDFKGLNREQLSRIRNNLRKRIRYYNENIKLLEESIRKNLMKKSRDFRSIVENVKVDMNPEREARLAREAEIEELMERARAREREGAERGALNLEAGGQTTEEYQLRSMREKKIEAIPPAEPPNLQVVDTQRGNRNRLKNVLGEGARSIKSLASAVIRSDLENCVSLAAGNNELRNQCKVNYGS